MNFFDHPYYKIPKILMMVLGQWPYQSNRIRYSSLIVGICFSISSGISILMAAFKYRHDRKILLDSLTVIAYFGPAVAEFINFAYNSKNMLQLLDRIRADWLVWAGDPELIILHQYAERARKFTRVYVVTTFSMVIPFLTQPLIPKIIDIVLGNGSKPGEFPIPIYCYHLDIQKYYLCLIIYICVCVSVVLMSIITYNVMVIIYVQHTCAIFAAVGHMLERIGKKETPAAKSENIYDFQEKSRAYEVLICSCIARHSGATEYVKLIEATFTWNFFARALCKGLIVSMSGFQLIKKNNRPEEIAKFMVVAFGMISYGFMESFLAQMVLDHSISIRDYIQNGEWYCLSLKAQKLLQFMLMRCNTPCRLTAGKVFDMSMEAFVVFLKTSMSYLTLLRSI